jgi:hypothetical protein
MQKSNNKTLLKHQNITESPQSKQSGMPILMLEWVKDEASIHDKLLKMLTAVPVR